MKNILGLMFICLTLGVISVFAQRDYCFKNDGLKITQNISYTLTKNKIEGTMESGGYDPNNSAETFDFTGTKTGNTLKVTFQGRPPYERPPGVNKTVIWTVSGKALRVPMYGKNYNTRKYGRYTATFEKCKGDI